MISTLPGLDQLVWHCVRHGQGLRAAFGQRLVELRRWAAGLGLPKTFYRKHWHCGSTLRVRKNSVGKKQRVWMVSALERTYCLNYVVCLLSCLYLSSAMLSEAAHKREYPLLLASLRVGKYMG